MALRNQPYLPLYVQDFLTDEKLAFCSASSTGVYIRLMCLMHKSENYGKILLKQKFKQNESNIKNFASQLSVQMPYDFNTILCALEELIDSKVLSEEPFALIQNRMVRDNDLSEKRSISGKKGGDKSLGISKKMLNQNNEQNKKFALNFAQANSQANTEYEIENENENEKEEKGVIGEKGKKEKRRVGKKIETDELIFPFESEKFKSAWLSLLILPKWKKKINHSLQIAINSIAKYDEDFAIELIEKTIAGNYQGITFQSTPDDYEKWKKQKGGKNESCSNNSGSRGRKEIIVREFSEAQQEWEAKNS
jgi:hypothetical protein